MKTPSTPNDALLHLLQIAPANSIPKSGTLAYRLLALLATGESVPEETIGSALGRHYRSPLQQLMGRDYDCWNIIPVYEGKGDIAGRKLDPRHLVGVPQLDTRARAERRVELESKSLRQSIHEKRRIRKAEAALAEAEEYLKGLDSKNN